MTLNIYHVARGDTAPKYDYTEAMIVIASNEHEARRINPSSFALPSEPLLLTDETIQVAGQYGNWVSSFDHLEVALLGIAKEDETVRVVLRDVVTC